MGTTTAIVALVGELHPMRWRLMALPWSVAAEPVTDTITITDEELPLAE
jgi:hypothetical protein